MGAACTEYGENPDGSSFLHISNILGSSPEIEHSALDKFRMSSCREQQLLALSYNTSCNLSVAPLTPPSRRATHGPNKPEPRVLRLLTERPQLPRRWPNNQSSSRQPRSSRRPRFSQRASCMYPSNYSAFLLRKSDSQGMSL